MHAATLAQWQSVPHKLFVHQIFSATFQALATKEFSYRLDQAVGLELIYDKTPIQRDDLYIYKRLYFKVTQPQAQLPQVTITTPQGDFTIPPRPLEISTLHPPRDFCGVLAQECTILKHQAIQYNKDYNLVVMKLRTKLGNVEDFHLPYAKKEEIKDRNATFPYTTALYYAIIPNSITQLKFSYFDTQTREFKRLFFDIKVKDETVSTQSDISPTEDKNKTLKIIVFASLGLLFAILFLWKKSFSSLLLALLLIGYAIYISIPLQEICVKRGSKIYILPTKNSTIFLINEHRKRYVKLNEVGDYVKIKLSNQKIGWVKHEDICKN